MSKGLSNRTTDAVDSVELLQRFGLTRQAAAEISKMPHRRSTVGPRRNLRNPGAAFSEGFLVLSGLLAKFRPLSTGKRQILGLRYSGECLLPREREVTWGLRAIMTTEVIEFEKVVFQKIIQAYPELAIVCLKATQRQASITQEWLLNSGSRDSMEKVAHLLCETAFRSGFGSQSAIFVNPFTQQQIAEITGQTSVSVNRVFAELERLGYLKRNGSKGMVADWSELTRLSGFTYEYLL